MISATVALWAPLHADAAATGETYVALGDSFSAGVGAPPYLGNSDVIPPVASLTLVKPPANVDYTSNCKRSAASFPATVATGYGGPEGFIKSFSFAACSGATTAEVVQRQWAALGPDVTLVSLTIGGNDIKFADAMTECVKPNILLPTCKATLQKSLDILRNDLPKKLHDAYSTIMSQAPQAKLIVLGYPKLFDDQGTCSIVQQVFNPTSQVRTLMNDTAVELSQAIHAAVADVGGRIQYIDVQPYFDGHGICGPDPYLTEPKDNLSNLGDSYHPNANGYKSYASAMAMALGA